LGNGACREQAHATKHDANEKAHIFLSPISVLAVVQANLTLPGKYAVNLTPQVFKIKYKNTATPSICFQTECDKNALFINGHRRYIYENDQRMTK
jgi:hypothetical protein